jgi:hypothetical protein
VSRHVQGKLLAEIAIFLLGLAVSDRAMAQSGYQTINGTRVLTEINQAGGYATFSNECGSQVLTQSQLQRGAIPTDIIPCPRPQRNFNSSGASGPPPSTMTDTPAATPPPSPPASKPKMVVNQAMCKSLQANADTCLARLRTAASGQGTSFHECINLYCEQMTKAGCNLANACRTGISSNGTQPVTCPVGQHLFFPDGYGSNAECQDNAPGGPGPSPGQNHSTITGPTSQ